MRVAKPIKLVLPKRMIEQIGNIQNGEKYHYFVHYLLMQSLFNKRIDENHNGFAPINKEKMSNVINYNTDSCIKFLLNEEIIIRDFYEIGTKPYYYKVNPNLINGDYSEYKLNNTSPIFNNIINKHRRKRKNNNRLEPYLRTMHKHLMKVSFDAKEAVKWIENNAYGTKKLTYLIAVNQIADKRFRYFKRNETNNRLDTNFTNLKSELRQFIKGDFVHIDLKNSQPFFLSVLLENFLTKLNNLTMNINLNNLTTIGYIPICLGYSLDDLVKVFGLQQVKSLSKIPQKDDLSEMRKFRNTTLQGEFYDKFVSFHKNGITRSEVKNLMFKVLFSQNETYIKHQRFEPYKAEKKIFASVFPTTYKAIEILKMKNHNQLAIILQKMESYIFIDLIAKKLVERGITPLTIHDSVIVPSEKENETLTVMKEVFNHEIGFVPTFEVEGIGKRSYKTGDIKRKRNFQN